MSGASSQDPTQRLRDHGIALLVRGRCPACAELVPVSRLFRDEPCPHCGGRLEAHRDASDRVVDVLTTRGRRRLIGVCAAVAVAHLVLGWIPLLETLTLLLAALWLRFGITMPAVRAMSPPRRIVATWTARLLVGALLAVTLVFTQLAMLLGPAALLLKAILGVVQVAGAAALITAYLHWQLRREVAREPVGAAEWVVLALVTAALLAAVAAIGVAFFFVLSAIDWVLTGLGAGLGVGAGGGA